MGTCGVTRRYARLARLHVAFGMFEWLQEVRMGGQREGRLESAVRMKFNLSSIESPGQFIPIASHFGRIRPCRGTVTSHADRFPLKFPLYCSRRTSVTVWPRSASICRFFDPSKPALLAILRSPHSQSLQDIGTIGQGLVNRIFACQKHLAICWSPNCSEPASPIRRGPPPV